MGVPRVSPPHLRHLAIAYLSTHISVDTRLPSIRDFAPPLAVDLSTTPPLAIGESRFVPLTIHNGDMDALGGHTRADGGHGEAWSSPEENRGDGVAGSQAGGGVVAIGWLRLLLLSFA